MSDQIKEIRTQLFALCEDISEEAFTGLGRVDLDEHQTGYYRGMNYAAKATARAMGEVFREMLADGATASTTPETGTEQVAAQAEREGSRDELPPSDLNTKDQTPTRDGQGGGVVTDDVVMACHPEPERTAERIAEAYAYLSTVREVDGAIPEPALLVQRLLSRLVRIDKAIKRTLGTTPNPTTTSDTTNKTS